MEDLSRIIGPDWKNLGSQLGFFRGEIDAFELENKKLREMAYNMLMDWKQKEGSSGTYRVLDDALRHKSVGRKDLAEKICYP